MVQMEADAHQLAFLLSKKLGIPEERILIALQEVLAEEAVKNGTQ